MAEIAIASRLRRLWRSPLNRLACFFSLALFVTYLSVTGLAALGVINQAQRARTGLINAEIEGLDQIYEDEDIPGLIDAINERVRAPRDPHAVYALLDAHGKILAGQFNHLPLVALKPGWVSFEWHQYGQASTPRVHIDAFVQALEDDELLLAGRDTSEQRRVFEFAYDLGAAALLTMALAAMALAYAFRRAIDAALGGPLETVHRFSMGLLTERVARNGSLDSFDQLGATLNSMLDRIQDLIGGIVHSTDAIAHDLRTPLSRLRTNLESLREQTQTPETADKVDAAIREAEQLMSRFAALLRLARIESTPMESVDAAAGNTHHPLDLAEIVADAQELWQPLAEEKSQSIIVNLSPALVVGDRDQLFQMVSNLLDNAIKYSPVSARIRLSTERSHGQIKLCVQDSGPGIPELDRERVFDRFVRLQADRSSPGIGLGLSLVRAIAIRHGATISLSDNAPGLNVEVCFSSSFDAHNAVGKP